MVWPKARLSATAGIWGLAAIGLIALIVFDLSPPLAFNDDWMYAWSVHRLLEGHGLQVFPESTALALVQVVWGAAFSLGHADPRLLRLSVVPFVGLGAWCTYRLARRLQADRFWAAVAATSLLAMPLWMANATSFMTDNVYTGLVLAVALSGLIWIVDGRGRWLCVVLLVVTPLERQLGLALVPAVTAGLLLYRRSAWTRSDTLALLGAWTLSPVAALAAGRLAISQPLYSTFDFSHLDIGHALFPLVPMLGLGLIPFAAALAFRPAAIESSSRWSLAAAGLGVMGAIGCLVDLARFGMIFPGNVFSPLGFSAILDGSKPPIFPALIFRAVEVGAVVTFVLLLVLRRRRWTPRALPAPGVVLLLISASQFVPLLLVQWFIYDRYFLPVLAPLVPVVAAVAAGALRQPAARGFAGAAIAAGLVLYMVGEQDYLAWQAARDRAALLAYQGAPREQVQAGFEANGVYVALPKYERTGRADLFAILGPAHPSITLRFGPASDLGAGVSYSSLAPGRIVLDR